MTGNMPPLKQQAHALIDNLPESATWDDVAYEAELRSSIEHGLADAEAGRIVAVEVLMKELGGEERKSFGHCKPERGRSRNRICHRG
jgi:hypothetical protein